MKLFGRKPKKKIGISYMGGGARTGAYIGCVQALIDNDIEISFQLAKSGGSLIAGAIAAGVSLDEFRDHFRKYSIKDYFSINSLKDLSLISSEKEIAYAKRLIGDFKLEDARIKTFFQATNLDTMQPEILDSGVAAQAAIASAALPVFNKPVEFKGNLYIDGGLSSGYGVEFLSSKGADVVIGLNTKIDKSKNHNDLFHRLTDSLLIASNKINELDLKLHPVDFLINDLGDGVSFLDFKAGADLFDEGYERMEAIIPDLKRALV